MDTYVLEKITGWTPDLSPPPDSRFYKWRQLAEDQTSRRYLTLAAIVRR
jgi:hypothetical protein